MDKRDTFTMDPIRIGGLIGAVVAFLLSGAIVVVMWVIFGAALGAGAGALVRHYAREAREYKDAVDLSEDRPREELYAEAQRLDIDGRSNMTRAQLAAAIAAKRAT